jgi:Tfp pilus assembly protein PilE
MQKSFNEILIYSCWTHSSNNNTHNTCYHMIYKFTMKYWFTLVELIVVITILTILATIWFISLQWYSKYARDGNRLSNIKQIEKWLELFIIQTWLYPQPDGPLSSWIVNSKTLSYVWEVWDNFSRMIRIEKSPKDPLSGTNYVYGTSSDYRYYQIAAVMEWSTAYNNPLVDTAYADGSSLLARVVWNYPGYMKFSSWSTETWVANIPSLIFNNTWSTNNLLSNTTYYVMNGETNAPYNASWIKDISIQNITADNLIKKVTNASNATLTWVNITTLTAGNFDSIFTWAILTSFNTTWIDI